MMDLPTNLDFTGRRGICIFLPCGYAVIARRCSYGRK